MRPTSNRRKLALLFLCLVFLLVLSGCTPVLSMGGLEPRALLQDAAVVKVRHRLGEPTHRVDYAPPTEMRLLPGFDQLTGTQRMSVAERRIASREHYVYRGWVNDVRPGGGDTLTALSLQSASTGMLAEVVTFPKAVSHVGRLSKQTHDCIVWYDVEGIAVASVWRTKPEPSAPAD